MDSLLGQFLKCPYIVLLLLFGILRSTHTEKHQANNDNDDCDGERTERQCLGMRNSQWFDWRWSCGHHVTAGEISDAHVHHHLYKQTHYYYYYYVRQTHYVHGVRFSVRITVNRGTAVYQADDLSDRTSSCDSISRRTNVIES